VISSLYFVDTLLSLFLLYSALLCEILQLVFGLVDGLLVAVAALIVSSYPENCQYAGITRILAVFNISI
jgi:hypothetical protein